jgi:hypothetical protein
VNQLIDSMWEGDVVTLVGRLAPGGSWVRDDYFAPCPIHREVNQSSFSFSKATRFWKCLVSCGQGDLATLLARVLGTDVETAAARITDLLGSEPHRIVAIYPYVDASGALLYEAVRYEPKCFSYRFPDRWSWKSISNGLAREVFFHRVSNSNHSDLSTLLYRLPEVLRAKELLIVEGEKDCETARAWGLLATCNPGGSGKWPLENAEVFRDKRVTIIADADQWGRIHAWEIVANLLPTAESVKILELPDAKDLSEWAANGGTREKLLEILEATPVLTPESSQSGLQSLEFGLVRLGDLFEEPNWPVRKNDDVQTEHPLRATLFP